MPSIPASQIVRVTPRVLAAGGSGLDLVGLILTSSTRVPIGSVVRFATPEDVSAYFGPVSTEATLAAAYFAGYDNSDIKPASLLFSQYNTTDVSAYLRGGSLASMTLAQLQALSGTITLTFEGTTTTSGTINLATALSFSNAALLIQTGINRAGITVAYDSVSSAFIISGLGGTPSTGIISFASGTLSAPLALTADTGAVVSQGAVAARPGTAMDAVTAVTQDFVSFTTTFKPSADDMFAFATWTNGRLNRFLYAMWDNAVAATTSSDTTSVGYRIAQAALSGIAPIYDPNNGASVAAFLMGAIASVDFTRPEGRITAAFRSGTGLTAGVTNASVASNLIANGYNFYGAYATANEQFVWFYPGQVSGQFEWIDSFINQVWMNARFQQSLLMLLAQAGSVPYNVDGYSLIEATLLDTIQAAVDFGAIRPGVTLTNLQAAEVNTAAGRKVSDVLQQRGWYVIVTDADPTVRRERGSPPVYFFYLDGQSVQRIVLSSVLVQ